MSRDGWREDVAALLAEAARALIDRQDHRARKALGTSIVYLEKAQARGHTLAAEILQQLRPDTAGEQSTERFTFAPGELEELKRKRGD